MENPTPMFRTLHVFSAQNVFSKTHSISTVMTNLTQHIPEGLNENPPPLCNILATVDINKALNQSPLSNKILNTNMHTTYIKWLTNFIAGRFT